MARTLKLTLAYDGTDFAGWQIQANNQRTLQGTLEDTLTKVTGQFSRVFASGRTDAGVHAMGQVVSFDTESALPLDVLQKALNAELPRDMAVLSVEEAPRGFSARSDARRKRYRYVIQDGPVRNVFLLRYAWHLFQKMDVDAMSRGAQALVGRHDFASFQTSGSERETTERTIFAIDIRRCEPPNDNLRASNKMASEKGTVPFCSADSAKLGQSPAILLDALIHIDVEADGFLYNMVRNIVGTLAEVGKGKQPDSWPAEVLAARNRREAGNTAPPQGLFLLRVDY